MPTEAKTTEMSVSVTAEDLAGLMADSLNRDQLERCIWTACGTQKGTILAESGKMDPEAFSQSIRTKAIERGLGVATDTKFNPAPKSTLYHHLEIYALLRTNPLLKDILPHGDELHTTGHKGRSWQDLVAEVKVALSGGKGADSPEAVAAARSAFTAAHAEKKAKAAERAATRAEKAAGKEPAKPDDLVFKGVKVSDVTNEIEVDIALKAAADYTKRLTAQKKRIQAGTVTPVK